MVPWPRFTKQLSFLKKQAWAEQPDAVPVAGPGGARAWGGGVWGDGWGVEPGRD